MTPVDLHDELELALSLADAVDLFTLPHFVDRDFTVDWKHNQTEVTEIDRHAESLIVERLIRSRPHHGVFGEEHGLAGAADSEWRWVIDPIDGTKGFLRGEQYAVALGLIENGKVVLGVLGCPNLPGPRGTGALFSGVSGQGAQVHELDGEGVDGEVVEILVLKDRLHREWAQRVPHFHCFF